MPSINQLGFSGYVQTPLEQMGFSATHRRDGADTSLEIADVQQAIPDLALSGDKIEELNISKLRAGSLRVDEYVQSTGFSSGVSGWRITGDGDAEFNTGTFRGSLVAGSIHIPDQNTTTNSFHTKANGDSWWGCTQTDFDLENGNAKAYVLRTGEALFQNIKYSPNQMFALFQVGITELPGVGTCLSMTRHGQYILAPYDAGAGVYQWKIWDAGAEYIYNYTRNSSITVTPLTILPRVSCVVLDGSTEYVLGFAFGGTACYRYDDDGTNETAITFSGTAITTGAYRIGYDKAQGYVYIMDDVSEGGTTIKRYTFAGTTLTYVDTVTLDTAPAAGGPLNMWIGDTYLILGDAYTNTSRVDYQRYAKNTGVQTTQKQWGHGTSGVNFVGHMIRMDDNALLFCTENDSGAGTTSLIQKIFLE